jgi:uncharacterized membrane protein YdbT with pleckstrin-like domain
LSYIESNSAPGETVLYETRLHWIVMLKQSFLGCLLLGLPGAFLLYYAASLTGPHHKNVQTLEEVGAFLLVCCVAVVLWGVMQRNAMEMALTNRRVVIKAGVVSRSTTEMPLSKVESIQVVEPALGRMLGYGTIRVIGTGGTTEPFEQIQNPLEFRRQVQQQVEKLA